MTEREREWCRYIFPHMLPCLHWLQNLSCGRSGRKLKRCWAFHWAHCKIYRRLLLGGCMWYRTIGNLCVCVCVLTNTCILHFPALEHITWLDIVLDIAPYIMSLQYILKSISTFFNMVSTAIEMLVFFISFCISECHTFFLVLACSLFLFFTGIHYITCHL